MELEYAAASLGIEVGSVCIAVVVGMNAVLDERSVDDLAHCEKTIVTISRSFLLLGSADQASSLFGSGIQPVVLSRANGIAIYFVCLTLSAIMNLRDCWRSKQLRHTLEKVFTFLSVAVSQVRIDRLRWPMMDYERCVTFFTSLQGWQMVAS